MQHAVPKTTYYWVTFWLMLLLVLTVLAAEFEAGSWNLPIALSIALAKTLLIVTFFMHLRFSSPLVRMFAAAGFLWLLILLVFLAADVVTRGWYG
jgi:cytochrome c oxidase subunit IV